MWFDALLSLFGASKAKRDAISQDFFVPHPGYNLSHVNKAISRRGYFKPESASWLLSSVNTKAGAGYASLDAAIRKNGVRLTQEEVKKLGLRANFILSQEYLNALTDEGQKHVKMAAYIFAEDLSLIERTGFLETTYQQVKDSGLSAWYKIHCPPNGCSTAREEANRKHMSVPIFPLPGCTQSRCTCFVIVSCDD